MAKATKSEAVKYIEKRRGGPLTFGALLRSIRECDEHTLEGLARQFGVSRSHLCDVEKGRRRVSAGRAARWAEVLGYPAPFFVRVAIQDELDAAGLKLKVEIKAA
jgi:transcriptional regulator with XRE-family HTH domain